VTKSLADKLSKQPTVAEELAAHQEKTVTRATKEKYKAALEEISRLEEKLSVLRALEHSPRPILPLGPRKKGNRTSATALLLLSDWHVEEHVRPETVNSLNEYTLAVAEKSVKSVFERFLNLLENERGLADIQNVVVHLGGDFWSGRLHGDQADDNQLSPTDAAMFASELMEWGLTYISKHAGLKHIGVCTSDGNHGRLTEKQRIATEAENSLENLIYRTLAWRMKGESKFGWQISRGYHNWIQIESHAVRLHHGHAFKYGGGVGGISIPINKKIAQWNKAKQAALDGFGHLHTAMDCVRWISNGSLIGYSPLAVKWGMEYQDPFQTLAIIDEKHCVTKAIRIFGRAA
jgi:hypothetical protein